MSSEETGQRRENHQTVTSRVESLNCRRFEKHVVVKRSMKHLRNPRVLEREW